jgi:hypothetical protein
VNVVLCEREVVCVVLDLQNGEPTVSKVGAIEGVLGRAVFSGPLVYVPDESTVFRIADGHVDSFPLYSETNLFVAYDSAALFCPDRCTIARCKFRSPRPKVRPICYSETDIIILTAHPLHQIIAFATVDNRVHINDAVNGGSLSVYDTEREVYEIVITNCWGFVVAFSQEMLFIFSVNGDFLKTGTLAMPASRVFPQSSASGLDFISFVTADGEMGVLDGLFPEALTVVAKVGADVIAVFYSSHHRAFVVMRANGSLALHPYCLEFS